MAAGRELLNLGNRGHRERGEHQERAHSKGAGTQNLLRDFSRTTGFVESEKLFSVLELLRLTGQAAIARADVRAPPLTLAFPTISAKPRRADRGEGENGHTD
jgi:hypothetical protein